MTANNLRKKAALITELADRSDAGALRLEPEPPLGTRGEALARVIVQSLSQLSGLDLLEPEDEARTRG